MPKDTSIVDTRTTIASSFSNSVIHGGNIATTGSMLFVVVFWSDVKIIDLSPLFCIINFFRNRFVQNNDDKNTRTNMLGIHQYKLFGIIPKHIKPLHSQP